MACLRSTSSTGNPSGLAAILTRNGDNSRSGGSIIARKARAHAVVRLLSIRVYICRSLIAIPLFWLQVSVRTPPRVLILGDAYCYGPAPCRFDSCDARPHSVQNPPPRLTPSGNQLIK